MTHALVGSQAKVVNSQLHHAMIASQAREVDALTIYALVGSQDSVVYALLTHAGRGLERRLLGLRNVNDEQLLLSRNFCAPAAGP